MAESQPITRSPLDELSHGWVDVSLTPKWRTWVDPSEGCAVGCAVGSSDRLTWSTSPGEWTTLGARPHGDDAVDLTHARVAVRLEGEWARALLSRICALDFDDRVFPALAAARTELGGLAAEIVRDDDTDKPSYLLVASRSYGRYLHEVLTEATDQLANEGLTRS